MTASPIHSRLPALVASAVIVYSPMAAGNRLVGVYPQSQARAGAVACQENLTEEPVDPRHR